MKQYYFNQFLIFGPQIFSWFMIVLVGLSIIFKKSFFFRKISYQTLVYFVLGVSFLYGLFLSATQYLVWRGNAFSQFFLPPYQPWSYFVSYSFFHFFLANIITLFVSFLVYLIFKIFQKYKAGFIDNQSANLLFLACLLSAWPLIIIFLILFFVASLSIAIFNLLVRKKQEINWFFPILISLILSLLLAKYLIAALGLSVLLL